MNWILIAFLSIVLIINTVYSFLPDAVKNTSHVLWIGRVAAIIILIYGLQQLVSGYLNQSYAVVDENGEIQKSKNFPWAITLTTKNENEPVYILNECFKDASELEVKAPKAVSPKIYNAIDGAAIQFISAGYGNPFVKSSFTVEIKKRT